MEKAIGLFRLAPIIVGIDNWVVGYLWDVMLSALAKCRAEERALEADDLEYIRDRRGTPTDEYGDSDVTDDELCSRGETALERASKLLNHPTIRHLDEGGLGTLRDSVETLRTSSNPVDLTDAAYDLVDACEEFHQHFFRRLPDHLLSEWGGELYRFLLDVAEGEFLQTLARVYGDEVPTESLSQDHNVSIDRSTFTVQMGKRRPCALGNGRQFKLLEHLVSRPFRYISFADLATVVGGDDLDRNAVIVTKHRLCKRLAKEGYDDLAKMIRTQPDHYAFWPG